MSDKTESEKMRELLESMRWYFESLRDVHATGYDERSFRKAQMRASIVEVELVAFLDGIDEHEAFNKIHNIKVGPFIDASEDICSRDLQQKGQPFPITCPTCGLGPCSENHSTTDFPSRPCRTCGKMDRPQFDGICNDGHCGQFDE